MMDSRIDCGQTGRMNLTRRETSRLLLAGALLPATALPGTAASSQGWARRFQRDLDAHLVAGCDGRLTLQGFGMGNRDGQALMAGVVQLDWPPGMRRRRFEAAGDREDLAYRQLLNLTLASFAKAWPAGIV